jgi:hypothetical protein
MQVSLPLHNAEEGDDLTTAFLKWRRANNLGDLAGLFLLESEGDFKWDIRTSRYEGWVKLQIADFGGDGR